MQRFQTKKRFLDVLYSPTSIILLVAIVAFLSRAAWNSFAGYKATVRARSAAEAQAGGLEEQKARLEQNAALIGSARATEQEIREKLRMAKPGEEVIMMVDDSAGQESDIVLNGVPWWRRFVNWVIN